MLEQVDSAPACDPGKIRVDGGYTNRSFLKCALATRATVVGWNVIASLAWSLKNWAALLLPAQERWNQVHE